MGKFAAVVSRLRRTFSRSSSRRSRRVATAPTDASRADSGLGDDGIRPSTVGDGNRTSDTALAVAAATEMTDPSTIASRGGLVRHDPEVKVEASVTATGGSAAAEAEARAAKEAAQLKARKKRMAPLVKLFGEDIVDNLLSTKWAHRGDAFNAVMEIVDRKARNMRVMGQDDEFVRLFRGTCKVLERGVYEKVAPCYYGALALLDATLDNFLPADAAAPGAGPGQEGGLSASTIEKGLGPLISALVKACSNSNARLHEKSIAAVMSLAHNPFVGCAFVAPHVVAPLKAKHAAAAPEQVARLSLLMALLPSFGAGAAEKGTPASGFDVEPVMSIVAPALSAGDSKVRKLAVAVAVEMYRHVGAEVAPFTRTQTAAIQRVLDKKYAAVDKARSTSAGTSATRSAASAAASAPRRSPASYADASNEQAALDVLAMIDGAATPGGGASPAGFSNSGAEGAAGGVGSGRTPKYMGSDAAVFDEDPMWQLRVAGNRYSSPSPSHFSTGASSGKGIALGTSSASNAHSNGGGKVKSRLSRQASKGSRGSKSSKGGHRQQQKAHEADSSMSVLGSSMLPPSPIVGGSNATGADKENGAALDSVVDSAGFGGNSFGNGFGAMPPGGAAFGFVSSPITAPGLVTSPIAPGAKGNAGTPNTGFKATERGLGPRAMLGAAPTDDLEHYMDEILRAEA